MQTPLTDLAVKNLAAPERGQRMYLDRSIAGFGVRVSQGGTKTFTLMYGPARRLLTIGRYPIISLSQARQKARAILAEKTLGIHQEIPRTSFDQGYDLFIKHYRAKNRPKTIYEMERITKRHFMPKFRRQQLPEITTHELTAIVDTLTDRPTECFATFRAARTMFKWFARRRLITRSPLENVPPPAEPPHRTRVLTDDEIVAVWRACHSLDNVNPVFATIVKLLILTGQRESQIAKLRREWTDRTNKRTTWPGEAMKNKREHTLPLAPMAFSIVATLVEEGYTFEAHGKDKPFNGFSKCKAALDKRAAIARGHCMIFDARSRPASQSSVSSHTSRKYCLPTRRRKTPSRRYTTFTNTN